MKRCVAIGCLLAAVMLTACTSAGKEEAGNPADRSAPQSRGVSVSPVPEIDPYDVTLWGTGGDGWEYVASEARHDPDTLALDIPENVTQVDTTVLCKDGGTFILRYLDDSEVQVETKFPCTGTPEGLRYQFPLEYGSVVFRPPAETDWSYQILVKH